jgi:hypothetical protein
LPEFSGASIKRAALQGKDLEPIGSTLAKHREAVARSRREAEPLIVARISSQQNEVMVEACSKSECLGDEGRADPMVSMFPHHSEWAEQERRLASVADQHRPIADCTDDRDALGCNPAQFADRATALAKAVRRFQKARLTEYAIVEALDGSGGYASLLLNAKGGGDDLHRHDVLLRHPWSTGISATSQPCRPAHNLVGAA